jgi:hypothetical protein
MPIQLLLRGIASGKIEKKSDVCNKFIMNEKNINKRLKKTGARCFSKKPLHG